MDETERYILKELAYSAERSTWFELNGQYAITLQDILTRKDAEIKRLRGQRDALVTISMERADEIERLREALRKIGEGDMCVSLMTHPAQCGRAYQARAALKEKE